MSRNLITDSIEIRSVKEGNKPRYIVKGTAAIANKKHTYEYSKSKDGSTKTLKSLFTPKCIQSIREQAKHRSLFVDIQHELARDASIKALIQGKLTPEEEKRVASMLERKRLPLAKISDINIYDDKLDIETELNPVFKEVDDEHSKYFDAVWYSLENKFLNGISVNFGNFEYKQDSNGDTLIDDVEILGFSYVDSPADVGNSIYEVAVRAIEEGISIRGVKEMEDEERKKIESEKAKLKEEREQFEKEKSELQKARKEEERQTEIRKQEEEQKRIREELAKKTEELKKAQEETQKAKDELNSVKGQAKQGQDKYGSQQHSSQGPEFYKERLKEITAEHDATIAVLKSGKQPMIDNRLKGIGELIDLQAKANSPTADLNKEDADFIRQNRLLDVNASDIITPKLRGEQ